MSLKVYEDLVQGTPEWLAARAGVLTASVIGKLVTPKLQVSKGETAQAVLERLGVEKATGKVAEVARTWDMRRGTFLEPEARQEYVMTFREASDDVSEVGFMTRTFDDGTLLGYSPDGVVNNDGLLEIKCKTFPAHWRTILRNRVPAEHMAQLQAGLLVSGREWIDYMSFAPGYAPWVIRVEPDPAWQEVLTAAAAYAHEVIEETAAAYIAATDGIPVTPEIELNF